MEDIIDIIVTETTNTIEITSQPTDEIIDVNIIDNREDVTLNVTPTLVEININSLTGNFGILWGEIEGTLSNQTDLQDALDLKADLVGGKVPSSQLPSYVDDVVEVANYASLPATGETGKIYVVLDTNKIYRWSGSAYIEIADSTAVWGAITGTLSSQTDLQTALNLKANDNEVVKLSGNQVISQTKAFLDSVLANNPSEGATGEGLIVGQSFKIDGTGTSQKASMYMVSNVLSDTYASGLVAQYANFAGDKAFGFNLNTTGGFELYVKNTTFFKALSIANTMAATFGSSVTATSFIKSGGTSAQFLKADGSVDSSTYLTTGTASSTYLPLAGGTLTGAVTGTRMVLVQNSADIALSIVQSGTGRGLSVLGTSYFSTDIQLGYATNAILKTTALGVITSAVAGTDYVIPSALSSYLPLSGGTLTGALSGTTANFNSNISVGGSNLTGGVLNIYKSNGWTVAGDGYTSIYSGTGFLGVIDTTGSTDKRFYLSWSPLTTSTLRTYTLPDASGTFALTSNLSSYLPLSGGTLTGALSGTSATFSDKLTINQGGSALVGLQISSTNVTSYASTLIYGTTAVNGSSGFDLIGLYTNGTARFRVDGNGAATFSSSVTAGTNITCGTGAFDTGGFFIPYSSASTASRNWKITNDQIVFGDFSIKQSSTQTGLPDTYRLYINASGNVGIGTTSPTSYYGFDRTLSVENASSAEIQLKATGGTNTLASFGAATNGTYLQSATQPLITVVNGAERMRITSGGDVLVGTTSSTYSATGRGLIVANGSTSALYGFSVGGVSKGYLYHNGTNLYLENSASGGGVFDITQVGAGDITFGTNGSERLRITSGGNVLIGTTTDASGYKFQVNGLARVINTNTALNYGELDANNVYIQALNPANTTAKGITFYGTGEYMRITSDGNVGIGTTTPASAGGYATLTVGGGGSTKGQICWNSGTSNIGYAYNDATNMYIGSDAALVFTTTSAATERMRITSGGDLLIGKTSGNFSVAGHNLIANGQVSHVTDNDAIVFLNRISSDGVIQYFYRNSSIVGSISVTTSSTAYNTTSDYRLKEDLKSVNGLELVNKIQVYDYKWKLDGTRMDGVLAHELAEVLPYAVYGIKDGDDMQQVDYSKIVPVLIQSIKELKSKIETLENK